MTEGQRADIDCNMDRQRPEREQFSIGLAHLHYEVTMDDRVSGRAVNSKTGESYRIRRCLSVLPEAPASGVVPAVTPQQGASVQSKEARIRLRDHGPSQTLRVSVSSDEETSAPEEADELMGAAPAASQSVAAASSSLQEVSCNAAGQLLGGSIAAAAPASAKERGEPPVAGAFQYPSTEKPICDQATRTSLSEQVLFPNVDGEFRQNWLDKARTIEFRKLYSPSDIHIIQALVSGDFGVPLSEQFYAVLWPYIKARDLGELLRADVPRSIGALFDQQVSECLHLVCPREGPRIRYVVAIPVVMLPPTSMEGQTPCLLSRTNLEDGKRG